MQETTSGCAGLPLIQCIWGLLPSLPSTEILYPSTVPIYPISYSLSILFRISLNFIYNKFYSIYDKIAFI